VPPGSVYSASFAALTELIFVLGDGTGFTTLDETYMRNGSADLPVRHRPLRRPVPGRRGHRRRLGRLLSRRCNPPAGRHRPGCVRYRLIRMIAAVALLAAGCADASRTAEPASGSGTPSTTTNSTAGSTSQPGTGEIIAPPVETPTKPPAATGPPPAGAGCRPTMSVRITPGARPDPVCLPISAQLQVTSDAAPHQPWSPLTSSNAKILSCASQVASDGTVTGSCTPHLGGTVTLTTGTPPPATNPGGAPQFRWTLTVNVVTYGFDN
jgi:hypothetical protein